MAAQSPKDAKKQYPPQPQPVHPAAIWRAMQKYLLQYPQTPEQLSSSGLEFLIHPPHSTTINSFMVLVYFVCVWYEGTTAYISLHNPVLYNDK